MERRVLKAVFSGFALFRSVESAVFILALFLVSADYREAAGESGFSEIWIFPEIHQDIGYTDTYDVTLGEMADCLETVVPYLEMNPKATFWWENVYPLKVALERKPHLFERTKNLIREGRLGVGATYSGIDATATPGESIVRTMTHGKWWMMETFGVEPRIATLIDMSGFPPQMPQILRKSGVDLLIYTRAYGPPGRPFECVALDGTGLPACFVKEGYDWFGFTDDPGEPDLGKMEKRLGEVNPEDWCGNVLWGFNCGGGDNDTPDMPKIQEFIDRWNEAHPDGPGMRFGLPSDLPDLFGLAKDKNDENDEKVRDGTDEEKAESDGKDAMEETDRNGDGNGGICSPEPWVLFGQTWPIIKREEPTFRAMSEVERSLFTAESLAVFIDTLGLAEIGAKETETIWGDFLWAYEHNWGGRGGGGSDRAKLEAARKAAKDAKEIEERNLEVLARGVQCEGRSVVVHNPLCWARSGVVEVSLDRGDVILGEDLLPVRAWYEEGDESTLVSFIARDIPAFGYRTFRIFGREEPLPLKPPPRKNPPGPVRAEVAGNTFKLVGTMDDNALTLSDPVSLGYLITMNTQTGAGWLNAQEEDGIHIPASPKITVRGLGAFGDEYVFSGEVESSPYETRITQLHGLDVWKIQTEIDYAGVGNRCVLLPLPFDARFSEVRLGTPFGSWVSPLETHRSDSSGFVPGETFSPQAKNARGHVGGWQAQATPWRYYQKWFDVRDPETGEGFLVAAELNNQAFYRDDEHIAIGLVQTLMFHDAWPRKTGIHRHRLAFRYHPGPVSDLDAARFGWETAMPLVGTVVPANPDGMLPSSGSFLDVQGDVIVTALEPAHDGEGAVLRAYAPGPEKAEFSVRGAGPTMVGSLVECDLLERRGQPLHDAGGTFGETLTGFEIDTYRLDIGQIEKGEGTE